MAKQAEVIEQRLSQASLFKSQGNVCYSEHRIRDAVKLYHHALLQLRSLDPHLLSPLPGLGPSSSELTPQQLEVQEKLQADCYNNLAACLLQSQPPKYERVYECSLQTLKIQPHNVKALYRAGVSSYHLNDYTTAYGYLSEAASQQPKDPCIRHYLQLAESAIDAFRVMERQRYQGMFD
ncbi:tetratricopeptide repeat protein 9C [Eleutherodactylus coqui]|uniref:Tetratricopeptide repeat protein 9C n=1 Tax=Eleutherodactylus coqui TaxID=57060 RepID=A0A8J6B785_ELECQ|nr:hypothetical protein GDO78_019948 [Eleutherodactylus coqui]